MKALEIEKKTKKNVEEFAQKLFRKLDNFSIWKFLKFVKKAAITKIHNCRFFFFHLLK